FPAKRNGSLTSPQGPNLQIGRGRRPIVLAATNAGLRECWRKCLGEPRWRAEVYSARDGTRREPHHKPCLRRVAAGCGTRAVPPRETPDARPGMAALRGETAGGRAAILRAMAGRGAPQATGPLPQC